MAETVHADKYCRLRKTCSTMKRVEQRQTAKEKQNMKLDLERKYCLKNKGVNVVIKEIKLKINLKPPR